MDVVDKGLRQYLKYEEMNVDKALAINKKEHEKRLQTQITYLASFAITTQTINSLLNEIRH